MATVACSARAVGGSSCTGTRAVAAISRILSASSSSPLATQTGAEPLVRDHLSATARVPVHEDPPTARALHATVAIGREIAPEHYRAVAAAIRFAERMRQAARARGLG